MERLSIEDLLLIAELVLDVPGEQLARGTRLGAARDALRAGNRPAALPERAAALCHRLVRERPLPYGNKPVALLAMLELISRNQGIWTPHDGGDLETATMVERLAGGRMSEADFAAWVRARLRDPG